MAARNENDGLLLYITSVVQLASKDRSIFTSYFSLATNTIRPNGAPQLISTSFTTWQRYCTAVK